MGRTLENNNVKVAGLVAEEFQFSHEYRGEKFYTSNLISKRESGTEDLVPITVSDRIVEVNAKLAGQFVRVYGQFRSYNKRIENRNRLILSVFANEIEFCSVDENQIRLEGFICKEPVYRRTPLGREITDFMLAVNRPCEKTDYDYIPCICWGRNARYVGKMSTGQEIKVFGRIQSREYFKKLEGDVTEKRTAYEVSIYKVEKGETTI